jgi:hypothetical protein
MGMFGTLVGAISMACAVNDEALSDELPAAESMVLTGELQGRAWDSAGAASLQACVHPCAASTVNAEIAQARLAAKRADVPRG